MFRIHRAALAIDSLGCQTLRAPPKANSRGFHFSAPVRRAEQAEEAIKGIPYSKLSIGVPKETFLNEKRIALVPAAIQTLTKKGFTVNVEENAGLGANFLNDDFAAAGANIVSRDDSFKTDFVLKVRAPSAEEVPFFRDGNTLFSFVYPAQNKDLLDLMAAKKMTVFGMECVPRISRAQVFDALSSMANISGYKAVVESANHFGRFFTGNKIITLPNINFVRKSFSQTPPFLPGL